MSSNESSSTLISNGISSDKPNKPDKDNHDATNGESIGDQPNEKNLNVAQTSNVKQGGNSTNGGTSQYETLKILDHVRNIEKINEKRRLFLTNTLTETVVNSSTTTNSDEKIESETTKTKSSSVTEGKCEIKVVVINESEENKKDIKNEHSNSHEIPVDKTNAYKQSRNSASLPPLKSPLTPPPKPPMLSRTRSLGVGDQRPASLPQTPANTPESPLVKQSPKTSPTSPTAVLTVKMTAPNKMTAICLRENPTVLRRIDRPISIIPDASKQISMNHYERLIEELRCPGCASPMKAPIMVCQTGHSICIQCTRVLLMCPLCKEPFTQIRSRTVEALCAKAHFRCCNSSGGCNVRLQTDLLAWHEKQCIYKPMKCFMGRVWGDCQWSGREIDWRDHLENAHANRMFKVAETELRWDMGSRQKPLTGYYVFDVFDELFNFYEIYDNERVLFTMTCTSTSRERKHYFAYEVTVIHPDNEALAITQKFPVHSEYDKDILAEGTCVSITLKDLAKFIDDNKVLHYRVRLMEVKTPHKLKNPRCSTNLGNGMHPIDYQQSQIECVNLKGVPRESIVTRKIDEIPFVDNAITPSSEMEAGAVGLNDEDVKMRKRYYGNEPEAKESSSDSDPELEAYIAKKWGTPQMHFNRKFLNTSSPGSGSSAGSDRNGMHDRLDDKSSITSRNTSYAKKMTNSLRKSFRSLRHPIAETLSFVKRSPEKKSP